MFLLGMVLLVVAVVFIHQWLAAGASETVHQPALRHASGVDVAVVLVLLGVGVGLWALNSTSDPQEQDLLDSPYLWWTWLFGAVVAFVAGYLRPGGRRPLWWSLALVSPAGLALAVQGTVLHDPDQGVSFWMLGELFIIFQGILLLAAATTGTARAQRRGRR